MRTFRYFTRTIPWQSLVVVVSLLVSSLLDGLGMFTLFPLLQVAIQGEAALEEASDFQIRVFEVLDRLGVPPELEPLMALVVAIFLTKGLVLFAAQRQVGYTVTAVATGMRLRLLRALLRTNWSYYTRLPVGQAINAMTSEADRAAMTYYALGQVSLYVLRVLITCAVAFTVSWQATVGAALAGLLLTVLLRFFVRMSARAGRRQTGLLRSLSTRLTDVLHSAKLLRATARESLAGDLLDRDTRRLNKALRKQVLAREGLRLIQEPLIMAASLVGLWAALRLAAMPATEILVLVLLFGRTLGDIGRAQRRYQSMVTQESALWSILGMIEEAEREEEPPRGDRQPTLERGVSLSGVTVVYEPQVILDRADLEIPAGGFTAIVGPSGAGKTTVVDLMVGLVRPTEGVVAVDGVPLSEIDTRAWRRCIGYVAQELLLLNDSVRINVTLGDPAITDAQVEQALRDAGAWEYVSQRPGGLDAPVGERGALLSGGQRQRLQIARALVVGPRLLVMDEATAALDPDTEVAVWATVSKLRGKTTVVAISHQPAVVDVADRVYHIEDGKARLDKDSRAAALASVEGVA